MKCFGWGLASLVFLFLLSFQAVQAVPTGNGSEFIPGNLGVGFPTPIYRLMVNGSVLIRDGSQQAGYILSSDANGLASWQPPSVASSEWTDGGTFLYPADSSGAESVVIGATTVGAGDIVLGADGSAIFNQQGANADFTVESITDPHAIFVDASSNQIAMGTGTPVSGAKLTVNGRIAATDFTGRLQDPTINGVMQFGANSLINGAVTVHGVIFSEGLDTNGQVVTAGSFVGSGLGLTNINATNISSGTLDAARLPASFSGAGITGLNASNIATGTLDAARLPSSFTVTGAIGAGSLTGTMILSASPATPVSNNSTLAVTHSLMRIQGSGGPATLNAATQIAAGTDGQVLIIRGLSNTNNVTIISGGGVTLNSSVPFIIGDKDTLTLVYDALINSGAGGWVELSRMDF